MSLQRDLVDGLRRCLKASAAVVGVLSESSKFCWAETADGEPMGKQEAIQFLGDHRYADGQESTESRRAFGVIGCSKKGARVAEAANGAREDFRNLVRERKAASSSIGDALSEVLERSAEIRNALSYSGGGRLNLLSCYRKILVVEEGLESVSFGWNCGGSVGRWITAAEARRKLEAKLRGSRGQTELMTALGLVSQMEPDDEVRLVRAQPPTPRANLVIVDEVVGRYRRSVHAATPILWIEKGRPPAIAPAQRPEAMRKRLKRIDALRGYEVISESAGLYRRAT